MTDIIKFILFLTYTVSVFFISSYYGLLVMAIINLILIIVLKIEVKNALRNMLQIVPFIILTAIINLLFQDIKGAFLVFIRLILVCNMTYIFSRNMTTTKFAVVLEKIFIPLKLLKIDPKDISIVVLIAITFIPILRNELTQIKYSLKSKGMNTNSINILKNLNLIFKPFFVSLLQRTSQIEMALKSKAYIEK